MFLGIHSYLKSENPLTFYSAIILNYKNYCARYGIYNMSEKELTNLFLSNELIKMNAYTNLENATFYSTRFVNSFYNLQNCKNIIFLLLNFKR